MSTNVKYYIDFQDTIGNNFRLTMIPGDTTDIASPTMIEFPVGSILADDFIHKRNLPNDFIIGIEETQTLEITIDLSKCDSTLQNYILSGQSSSEYSYTIGSLTWKYKIPNLWTLTKNSQIIFQGFQDFAPDIELSGDILSSSVKYKITISDSVSSLLKRIYPAQIGYYLINNTLPKETTFYYDWYTWQNIGNTYRIRKVIPDGNYHFWSLTDLINAINSIISTIAKKMYRNSLSSDPPVEIGTNFLEKTATFVAGSNEITLSDTSGIIIGQKIQYTISNNTYESEVTDIDSSTYKIIIKDQPTVSGVTQAYFYGSVLPLSMTLWDYDETASDYPRNQRIARSDTYFIGAVKKDNEGYVEGLFLQGDLNNLLEYNSMFDFFQDLAFANAIRGVINFNKDYGGFYNYDGLIFIKAFDSLSGTLRILKNSDCVSSEFTIKDKAFYFSQYISDIENVEIKRVGSQSNDTFETNQLLTPSVEFPEIVRIYSTSHLFEYVFKSTNLKLLFFKNSSNNELKKIHHSADVDLGKGIRNNTYTTSTIPISDIPELVKNSAKQWLEAEKMQFPEYKLLSLLESNYGNGWATIEITADAEQIGTQYFGDILYFEKSDFEVNGISLSGISNYIIITAMEYDILNNKNKIKGVFI